MKQFHLTALLIASVLLPIDSDFARAGDDSGLVGHWKLSGDARDYSGHDNHARIQSNDESAAVRFSDDAALFDGINDALEVPASESISLGTGDFSIAVHVHTEERLDDVLGDIVSRYDPAARRGFNFGIMNHAGVTSTQSNFRNVHFGIDDGRIDAGWTDCGRPGNNLFVFALCVYNGHLYAGTFETGKDEAGHVYRYAGGSEWEDCGSPARCNAVASLCVYDGKLYAGTANYRARGSALPDSPNQTPGGHVYRYEGDGNWVDCGRLGDAADVYSMAVYQGRLFAFPLYSKGLFRYEGGQTWADLGHPGCRFMTLAPFNGDLYLTGNGGDGIFRYDAPGKFSGLGGQADTTQVYSLAAYRGNMHAGTWPTGSVFRHDGGSTWTNVGRLGEELEVMGMLVYNGKLYAGTLPLAKVFRYDGGEAWTDTGQLDHTPDVRYRRAWSMAVFKGKLFAGTLPSGHVYSLEAGRNVTYDRALQPGWRHLCAVKQGDRLHLYVDGEQVATSNRFDRVDYDLTTDQPITIGFGANDHFKGKLKDLRIYNRALNNSEVSALSAAF